MGMSRSKTRRRSKWDCRSGAETIELIVSLPLLFFALIGIVQYSIQTLVQQAVTQAAQVAAREAGKGATLTNVVDAVNTILAPHNITISSTAGSLTKVVLETSDTVPVTTTVDFGDPGVSCTPPSPTLGVNEARVTICIGLTKTPLLNALPSFGFDTTGKQFEISSLVKKE